MRDRLRLNGCGGEREREREREEKKKREGKWTTAVVCLHQKRSKPIEKRRDQKGQLKPLRVEFNNVES
jgi:hypothetical protein